jgi:hypothetical protein
LTLIDQVFECMLPSLRIVVESNVDLICEWTALDAGPLLMIGLILGVLVFLILDWLDQGSLPKATQAGGWSPIGDCKLPGFVCLVALVNRFARKDGARCISGSGL